MLAVTKEPRILILLIGLTAVIAQDVSKKKNCDCKCKTEETLLDPIVNLRFQNEKKSGCNICDHRKEMLRKEKEKELQFQKCPFEILGTPSMKEKTSEELFDGFRELLVPSQNGFFDMLRGVVKTMHVSSESELKWAKEKEAKLLAQKKLMAKEKEKERKIEEEQKKAEDMIDDKEEVHFEIIELPLKEKSPFLKALFGKKDVESEPQKMNLDYETLQYPNEEEASNLQNLELEKVLKRSRGTFSENIGTRTPPPILKKVTEEDLFNLAPTCKKEKEIFKSDHILDHL